MIRLGIDGVYVEDALSKGIEIQHVITPELRSEGLSSVRERDVDKCQSIAKRIVDQMMNNEFCTLDMADLRTFDDYTFAHSVNVATVSCAIGLGLQLSENELTNIVLAGLLHDMGKLDISPDHHENVDGSGYPSGKKGHELSLITKIIHVADVYDALIYILKPFTMVYIRSELRNILHNFSDISI